MIEVVTEAERLVWAAAFAGAIGIGHSAAAALAEAASAVNELRGAVAAASRKPGDMLTPNERTLLVFNRGR